MQLKGLSLAALALALGVEGCKCYRSDGTVHVNIDAATDQCCKVVKGKLNGNDCAASSISKRLSKFFDCCASNNAFSDCHCPISCTKRQLEELFARDAARAEQEAILLAEIEERAMAAEIEAEAEAV